MRGQQAKKAEAPERVPRKGSNDHFEAYELMKKMGSKNGYSPMPPDQHRWQMGKGEAPLHRIWAWLACHTIAWGHRQDGYAIGKDGRELHMEHLAADLEMDTSNCYRTWKQGLAMGVWRNGTAEEGERKLYFNGSVPIPKGEEKANQIVCTDNLPARIAKQIKDWPKERREQFTNEWRALDGLGRELTSKLVASGRSYIEREQDTLLARYDVKAIHQVHIKKGETPKDAAARRAQVEPFFDLIELSVQTIRDAVQSRNGSLYNGQNGAVQTAVSLLPIEIKKGPENPSAGGSSVAAVAAGSANPLPHEELKPRATVPTQGRAEPKAAKPSEKTSHPAQGRGEAPKILGGKHLPELEGALLEAEDLLFSQILHMQQAFKSADFSRERISRDNAADVLFVRRVLDIIRPENMMFFLVHVAGKFKGLDKDGMAKAPSRAPGQPNGPRSLGLILYWAKDWARDNLVKPLGLEGV
jgi:hypothetical protein